LKGLLSEKDRFRQLVGGSEQLVKMKKVKGQGRACSDAAGAKKFSIRDKEGPRGVAKRGIWLCDKGQHI